MKKFLVSCILIVFILSAFIGCDLKDQELKESNTETPSQTDENGKVDIDLPKLKSEPYCDFEDFSAWWDENGNRDYLYVYIKTWDVYRKLELQHFPGIDLTSIAIGENTATLSINSMDRYTTKITSYHLDINKEDVTYYTVEVETPVYSEVNQYFINMHSENEGYFFFIPESEDPYQSKYRYPLIRYKTTDGGKTWNRIENVTFGEYRPWVVYPTTATFISHYVGIVDFPRDHITVRGGGTYVTIDGGLTWNKIPKLPYPDSFYNEVEYTKVSNFEIIDNSYILTIEGRFKNDIRKIKFKSDDLVNWSVIE